jgi:hypothetical protein
MEALKPRKQLALDTNVLDLAVVSQILAPLSLCAFALSLFFNVQERAIGG